MFVHVKKYSEVFLSVKSPYYTENVEKIEKINGRKWNVSDNIWLISDDVERIKLLYGISDKDKVLFENHEFDSY